MSIVAGIMGLIFTLMLMVLGIMILALPIIFIVVGIKKSKKVIMLLGIALGVVYVWLVVSHMMRVSALNKMQNVFSGLEVTIADEGLQPEGFYVSFAVKDGGIIEETKHGSKISDALSMYKQRDAVSFKGVSQGETYLLWHSQYNGNSCCIQIYSVIVDEELNVVINDIETCNINERNFDKYDSNVAKTIVNIKDKYGFSDEDIARAFPGIDIEVIDEEGESPINE